MKFCAKCGTQMDDEVKMCPQCNFPVFEPITEKNVKQNSPKRINKLFIIIPLVIIVTVIVTFTIAALILPQESQADKTDISTIDVDTTPLAETIPWATESASATPPATETTPTTSIVPELYSSVCPDQEYGNHDWAAANCIEPSHCYECGIYLDENLGNHQWQAATCIEPMSCYWCNAYKDETLGHHDFRYDEEIEEVACYDCNMLKTEYDKEEG